MKAYKSLISQMNLAFLKVSSFLFILVLLDCLQIAKGLHCDPEAKYRSLDGTCNNPFDSSKGSTGKTLHMPISVMPENYRDILPSAREVSNKLMSTWSPRRSERLTDLFTYFAQLIDHDIIRFVMPRSQAEQFPILVPKDDRQFSGPTLPFKRLKKFVTRKGMSPKNELSAFIDASLVYGTTERTLLEIRNATDGCKLNTGEDNMLPFLKSSIDGKFLAGDPRVNENILLASLHTLWMREHNLLCTELTASFPKWSSERRFQEARKILGAELQKVTYEEWIPAILGPDLFPPYTGYNKSLDSRTSLIFAGATFRIGHVLVNDAIVIKPRNGSETHLGVEQTLFSTTNLLHWGLDPVIRGAISNKAKRIDLSVIHALRNLLVLKTGGRNMDLASINIQRGRDIQIPLYNEARKNFGLRELRSFNEVSRDRIISKRLKDVYGDIEKIDTWVGGLSEDRIGESLLGELFTASWIDEFRRIRDGDRFFYKNFGLFDEQIAQKNEMLKRVLDDSDRTLMKQIIVRNTGLKPEEVPDNPFIQVGA